ncbi:MAG TPA: hypothetical protein VHB50_05405 [Bryobacteraceae bacterium]|nr:hypothetical protein [Bryobacteraceae bacterium]
MTLTCNTATGAGNPASVVVKPATALTGSNTIAVTLGSLSGGVVVTAPATSTLSTGNQAAGLVYSVSLAAGCVGVSTGAQTFRLNAGGVADVTVTVNTTLVASASGLNVSPSPVTISCVKNGSVYTPGAAQTVSVTSIAAGGTPFTVDTSTNPPPNWLAVNPTSGGTAGSSHVTFTVAAAAGCGGFANGTSNSGTIHLLDAPGPDKLVPVTLQIVGPSPLTATPNPASLTYVKGSGNAGHVDVNITSAAAPRPSSPWTHRACPSG